MIAGTDPVNLEAFISVDGVLDVVTEADFFSTAANY